jgi:hypothetical protein
MSGTDAAASPAKMDVGTTNVPLASGIGTTTSLRVGGDAGVVQEPHRVDGVPNTNVTSLRGRVRRWSTASANVLRPPAPTDEEVPTVPPLPVELEEQVAKELRVRMDLHDDLVSLTGLIATSSTFMFGQSRRVAILAE